MCGFKRLTAPQLKFEPCEVKKTKQKPSYLLSVHRITLTTCNNIPIFVINKVSKNKSKTPSK